ncbi:hypothetical protein SPHINGO8BC_51295 [Sphingobacterium multivorum]|uniref:Uncharacterized protein n=1 Tax=Sphingobacterium multivorum TaxID=28454 RepID=A0A654CXS7_SPHMU|nr:hypothetical protein SPHINGO8BC_51295 [Sphingobacterium multivorum]
MHNIGEIVKYMFTPVLQQSIFGFIGIKEIYNFMLSIPFK